MLSPDLRKELEALPVIMTVAEVAEFFSVCHMTVYRMIYKEELPAYKDESGAWNINRIDLIRVCSRNSNL